MAFPTSPTNGDIYVKDSVSYQYTAASNTWDIITDPDKIASNIKDGIEIDGVTGTYKGATITGELNFPLDGGEVFRYYKCGDLYMNVGGSNALRGFMSDTTTKNKLASDFGFTPTTWISGPGGATGNGGYHIWWNGSSWSQGPVNVIIAGFIK